MSRQPYVPQEGSLAYRICLLAAADRFAHFRPGDLAAKLQVASNAIQPSALAAINNGWLRKVQEGHSYALVAGDKLPDPWPPGAAPAPPPPSYIGMEPAGKRPPVFRPESSPLPPAAPAAAPASPAPPAVSVVQTVDVQVPTLGETLRKALAEQNEATLRAATAEVRRSTPPDQSVVIERTNQRVDITVKAPSTATVSALLSLDELKPRVGTALPAGSAAAIHAACDAALNRLVAADMSLAPVDLVLMPWFEQAIARWSARFERRQYSLCVIDATTFGIWRTQ